MGGGRGGAGGRRGVVGVGRGGVSGGRCRRWGEGLGSGAVQC